MQDAINAPLIERSVQGARGIVYTLAAADPKLSDFQEAEQVIIDIAGPDCNIIFGTVTDPELADELHVTVIATGFGDDGPGGLHHMAGDWGSNNDSGNNSGNGGHHEAAAPQRRGNPFARNGPLRIL